MMLYSKLPPPTISSSPSRRLHYIDILRGMTILLVVIHHLNVWFIGPYLPINEVMVKVRMPLFFFISGLFAYSPTFSQDLAKKRIRNRVRGQLYPTFIVGLIYTLLFYIPNGTTFKDVLYAPDKGGYWFTFVAVEIFLLFVPIAYFMYRKSISAKVQSIIYLCFILMCPAIFHLIWKYCPEKIDGLLCVEMLVGHIPYFFLGVFVKLNLNMINERLTSKWILFMCVVLFVIGFVLLKHGTPLSGWVKLLTSSMGVIAIYGIFYNLRYVLTTSHIIGRVMSFLGKNTLQIYLLHYFFISILRQWGVGKWFTWGLEYPTLCFIVFIFMAVGVATLCMCVDVLLKKTHTVKFVFPRVA